MSPTLRLSHRRVRPRSASLRRPPSRQRRPRRPGRAPRPDLDRQPPGPAAAPAEPTALAVRGERLIAVGSDAEIAPLVGPATRVLDAGGKRLLPGFIDSHTHFFSGGESLLGADLRLAASREEFVAQTRRVCSQGSRRALDHQRHLGPRALAGSAAADARVDRRRGGRSPGLHRPAGRPHGARQLEGAGRGRHHRGDEGPRRRRHRPRPSDRRADRRPQGRRRDGPRLQGHSAAVARRARRRPRRGPGRGGAASASPRSSTSATGRSGRCSRSGRSTSRRAPRAGSPCGCRSARRSRSGRRSATS